MKKKFLFIPLFALFLLALLTGCNGSYSYPNASLYTAGNGSVVGAASLDIDWIGGKVNVEYSDSAVISFAEETDFDLENNENMKMRWFWDGTVLRFKFAKSGAKIPNNINKSLTITVPRGTVFNELDVETVSADIECKVDARSADFESVSGEVAVTGTISNNLNFETVSGDVKYSTHTLKYATQTLPSEIEADTVSGNVVFNFPLTASFTVAFESVSGYLHTDSAFQGTQNGKYFTVNGGSSKIEADTVSGDCTLISLPD